MHLSPQLPQAARVAWWPGSMTLPYPKKWFTYTCPTPVRLPATGPEELLVRMSSLHTQGKDINAPRNGVKWIIWIELPFLRSAPCWCGGCNSIMAVNSATWQCPQKGGGESPCCDPCERILLVEIKLICVGAPIYVWEAVVCELDRLHGPLSG